jgi:FAD-dependent urate hydroxylase
MNRYLRYLLGDAAHAMTPNLGQGAGQAIEDAIILANLLKHHSLADALERYEKERIGRTRQIARVSNRIGRIAQMQGSISVALRDSLFPLVPAKVFRKQLQFLYKVKLEGLL